MTGPPRHALPSTGAPLPITGERTVPGVAHENYWFQRHVVAYRWAATRCRNAAVVDAGCGEGYGLAILDRRAGSVTGVELVQPVVDHARRAYPRQQVLAADICDTGLPTDSIDVVVNLQVIEHLPDVPRFLAEVRRLLRPGGQLLLATPNRLTFSPHDHHGANPTNVFHVEEFTAAELVQRLQAVGGFTVEQILGVHHGPRINAIDRLLAREGSATSFIEAVLMPNDSWPTWLAATVRHITPDDFLVRRGDTPGSHSWGADIDSALDLLVVARAA